MSQRELIRVLVCDDSASSRRTVMQMLGRSPLVEVVGVAEDGEEALRKVYELEPDVVTLDLEMPQMDGFTVLRLVMSQRPTPVIVISGHLGQADVFRALELGAADFIAKPGLGGLSPEAVESELLRKVHAIRELRIDKVRQRLTRVPGPAPHLLGTRARAPRAVAIGSSTGGPAAVTRILGAFLEAPPVAVLVAQHMPEGFTRGFADRLGRLTPFRAHEAVPAEEPRPGTVLVAPGGRHLELERSGGCTRVRLAPRLPEDRYVPSVDRLFASAAKHFGPDLLALVLTGMGSDGREGARRVREAGGRVVAESEESAVVFGMPQQAIRSGCVDAVLPLDAIPDAIRGTVAWETRCGDGRGRPS